MDIVHADYGQRSAPRKSSLKTVPGNPLAVRAPLLLRLDVVTPQTTRASVGDVIVIRRGQNRLYLYDGKKQRRVIGVATGQSRYPTPQGH